MKKITVNRKIMVKPYISDRKIKSKVSNGFASIIQKSNIIPLEVMADSDLGPNTLSEHTYLKKGSMVYVLEEFLHAHQKVLTKFTIKDKGEEFMLIDYSNVIMIEAKA